MDTMAQFKNLDDIVRSIADPTQIEGTYATLIEEHLGLLDRIKLFLTSKWDTKLIVIGVLALAGWMSYVGIDPKAVWTVVILGLALYVWVKGWRLRPDMLIVTPHKVILVRDIFFNKNTGTVEYDEIDECARDQVGKYFRFQGLNPLYHVINHHFRLGGKKFIMSRSLLLRWKNRKTRPTLKRVSYGQMKRLLHRKA